MAESAQRRLDLVYSTVAARRVVYDSLMWQVPAMGFPAQAFLLTIAFAPDTARWPRFAAAVLSAIVALLSMQLMSKHRYHERLDSLTLEAIEEQGALHIAAATGPHARPDRRAHALLTIAPEGSVADALMALKRPWYVRQQSYRVWMLGLGVFVLTGLAIAVATILNLPVFR